ncbi:MAG: hypothetical protein IKA13_08455 [Bacteroidales bacterium]|nr:hypothetical protein [Bacteroidales bacterium]
MLDSSNIILNVKTVPAFDTEKMRPHTAYTVYQTVAGQFTIASGWTLKDALDLYARLYNCNRNALKVKRPFIQQ